MKISVVLGLKLSMYTNTESGRMTTVRLFTEFIYLYSETMLIELGFIICRHSVNNISYADVTVLIVKK